MDCFLQRRDTIETDTLQVIPAKESYLLPISLRDNIWKKELGAKVENMIATAKREVEESLVKSLEQKLKENLAKETIERMNIPDVLKRFSEMALEDKTE